MPRKPKSRARPTAESAESVLRALNITKFYATNVRGGPTTQDFRFQLMNEKILDEDEWHYVSDALVILTPTAAKRLLTLLDKFVASYEKEHGKIQTEFPVEKTY